MPTSPPPAYQLEFYESIEGDSPVYRWLLDMDPEERSILGMAMRHLLQVDGPALAVSRFGRALGRGLFELRLDDTVEELLARLGFKRQKKLAHAHSRSLLFRVFFGAGGKAVLVVLAGYDKGRHTAKSYQQRQIALARERFADWKRRQDAQR